MESSINWQEILKFESDARLEVLPLGQTINGDELLSKFTSGRIFVCDAYVGDIETFGQPIDGGFQDGRLFNIDHHANDPRMQRIISSTPLAIQFVKLFGSAGPDDRVVINHLDCDSVLSAAIMLGILPPAQIFADAAIAADHTGEANDIADLLQALDRLRNFQLSIRSLAQMELGLPLDPEVDQRRATRLAKRDQARQMVEQGEFQFLPGGVAWAQVDSHIDGAFFPALLPGAKVIMIASPMPDGKPGLRMSIRLGLAAPEGMTLHRLGIWKIDPRFGGRWNAGSNNRGGGTAVPPEEYAKNLDALLVQKLAEFQVAVGD